MTAETEETLRRVLRREADRAPVSAPPLEAIFAIGSRSGPSVGAGALGPRGAHRYGRRRPLLIAGSVLAGIAAVVAAFVVIPGATTPPTRTTTVPSSPPPSSPPPASSPAVSLPERPPAGTTSHDYGPLRLWLPQGWSNGQGFYDANCAAATVQSLTDVVFSEPAGQISCPNAVRGQWILITRDASPPPRAWTKSTINTVTVWKAPDSGIERKYDIPSFGLRLTATGTAATAVAATLEPSALHALLATHYPTPVPRSWRTVSYGDIHLRVPSTWPVEALGGQLAPGECGGDAFARPVVDVGPGAKGAVNCPSTTGSLSAQPGDGIWLDTTSSPSVGIEGQTRRLLTAGGSVLIDYSTYQNTDFVTLAVDIHGHLLQGVLGLGSNPTVAETVLSSILTAGRATATNTP